MLNRHCKARSCIWPQPYDPKFDLSKLDPFGILNLYNTKIGSIFPEGQSSLHSVWMQSLLRSDAGSMCEVVKDQWIIWSKYLKYVFNLICGGMQCKKPWLCVAYLLHLFSDMTSSWWVFVCHLLNLGGMAWLHITSTEKSKVSARMEQMLYKVGNEFLQPPLFCMVYWLSIRVNTPRNVSWELLHLHLQKVISSSFDNVVNHPLISGSGQCK